MRQVGERTFHAEGIAHAEVWRKEGIQQCWGSNKRRGWRRGHSGDGCRRRSGARQGPRQGVWIFFLNTVRRKLLKPTSNMIKIVI